MTTTHIILYLLGINLLTFITYWRDKHAAKKRDGAWRTPEATLHMMALLGGTPAAFVAQKVFRHKTKKQSFRFRFWLIIIVQVGVVIWYNFLRAAPAVM